MQAIEVLLHGDIFPPVIASFAEFLPGVGDELVEAVLDQAGEVAGCRQLGALRKVSTMQVVVASRVEIELPDA